MNSENWKIATRGRDRKKKSADTPTECQNGATYKEVEQVDYQNIYTMKSLEHESKYKSFENKAASICQNITTLLATFIEVIEEKYNEAQQYKNDKVFVQEIHNLCTQSRKMTSSISSSIQEINRVVNKYEEEKAKIIKDLKIFIDNIMEATSSGTLFPTTEKEAEWPAICTKLLPNKPPQESTLAVSIGLTNIVVPVVDSLDDILPMSICYSPKLNTFLFEMDKKVYSFCQGKFICKPTKDGDNTTYGKRCDQTIARCQGAQCTYFHDPLTHETPHVFRKMGVHYVVSELINGISNDENILVTAQGKNKYIVEDLVQLAGMLLLKAYTIKKLRAA